MRLKYMIFEIKYFFSCITAQFFHVKMVWFQFSSLDNQKITIFRRLFKFGLLLDISFYTFPAAPSHAQNGVIFDTWFRFFFFMWFYFVKNQITGLLNKSLRTFNCKVKYQLICIIYDFEEIFKALEIFLS